MGSFRSGVWTCTNITAFDAAASAEQWPDSCRNHHNARIARNSRLYHRFLWMKRRRIVAAVDEAVIEAAAKTVKGSRQLWRRIEDRASQ
jgi:hypothetical protein